MKLNYFYPRNFLKGPLLTLRVDGTLYGNINAINIFNLNERDHFLIGVDENYESNKTFYLVVQEEKTFKTFTINKTGNYLYIPTKSIFTELKIDFKKKKQVYAISEFNEDGLSGYKLTLVDESDR